MGDEKTQINKIPGQSREHFVYVFFLYVFFSIPMDGNAVKQSTWRIWTGPLRTWDGICASKKSPKTLFCQDHGKGGLSLRGVAFMTVLAVLAVLESTLPSFSKSYKTQDKEATVTVLAVSAVMAVSVMTATPLKLNPPFL